MAKWTDCVIHSRDGEQKALAPLVISASRATDIPAFHSAWFMERLKAGYCVWNNPFNAAQRQYISFSQCKVIVFWTKNPVPLLPYVSEIRARGYQCYFQYTLNAYTAEHLEPHVPALEQGIATFQELSRLLGKERVVWRYDPIIMGDNLSVDTHLARMSAIGKALSPYTEKLVFSFLDMYQKTVRNLAKMDVSLRAPDAREMQQLAQGIARINTTWEYPLMLASCSEKIDLTGYGIQKNSCIDAELILRLCPHDKALQKRYASKTKTRQGAEQGSLLPIPVLSPKDTGQRTACACTDSKDIGCYNTCLHGCVYCYANS